MVIKYVAEPSDKMNGLYDVTVFDEEKQVYLPFERDVIKSVAENRAKYLNDEYILEEIRHNYVNHPTDTHLFVDNSNPSHYYILKNINQSWDDVLLIEFYELKVRNILHGNDIHGERGSITRFCVKMLDVEHSGYKEYLINDFFQESASIIHSQIEEIISGKK